MKYVALSIILVINISFLILAIRCYFRYKRDEKQSNIIIWHIFFLGVAVLVFLVFVGLFPILCLLNILVDSDFPNWYEGMAIYSIILIPLLILSLYLFFLAKNWKVEIFEDHILYHNIWGRIKEYKFDDVEVKYYSASLRVVKPYTKIVKGKKKKKYKTIVRLSYFCQNYENLYKAYKDYIKSKKIKTKLKPR